jgi:acetyltransferase-like isoleucine patch superfamily enzyme
VILRRILPGVRTEAIAFLEYGVAVTPGRTGFRLRRTFWRRRLGALGTHPRLGQGLLIDAPSSVSLGDGFESDLNVTLAASDGGSLSIGDNVNLGGNVTVDASAGGVIRIGDNTGIAMGSVLRSSGHEFRDPNVLWKKQGHRPGTIVIEDDVWVAANVIILPGTLLRRGCVVSSGSVVGGEFPEFSILAGHPARVVGKRGADLNGSANATA